MFKKENIHKRYLDLSKRIKNFLLSDKSREFFIFLFFFFIASGFWLLQTLNDEYETSFKLPLQLKNVPDSIVLTSLPQPYIEVRVKDKGTVLMNYKTAKRFLPVPIDFNEYLEYKNNHVRIPSVDFERIIYNQLYTSTRINKLAPDTIEYIYSKGESKRIPIQLTGQIQTARQYYICDTLFTPDSITAYAPLAILDTLKLAYTEAVNQKELSDTLKIKSALIKQKGVKFLPDNIEVTIPIDAFTEKTVEVPIHGINFPADKVLRTFPSKVNVTFQVGLKDFNRITKDNFTIIVAYEELINQKEEKYTVKLKKSPIEANHIKISPAQVDYIIEQTTTHEE